MKKSARALLGATTLTFFYTALYIGNSLAGGYWLKPVRDGKHLCSLPGFSMHDAVQWQPRWGYAEKYNKDNIGIFFYPLLRLDQKFWHRTRYISDGTDFHWISKGMSVSEVHPNFRAEFLRSKEPRPALQTPPQTNEADHTVDYPLAKLRAALDSADTQTDMNLRSYDIGQHLDDKLTKLEERIRGDLVPDSLNLFNKAAATWREYRSAQVSFEGDMYKGGSIQPLIHNSVFSRITEERLDALSNLGQEEKYKAPESNETPTIHLP